MKLAILIYIFDQSVGEDPVHGEFLTRPETLVKCIRVRTTETYLSTWPGRINRLARETLKPRISAAIEVLRNPSLNGKFEFAMHSLWRRATSLTH